MKAGPQQRRGEQHIHGVVIFLGEPIGVLQGDLEGPESLSVGMALRLPAGLFFLGASPARATTAIYLADAPVGQALRTIIVPAAVRAARFPGHSFDRFELPGCATL
jgi:hypothetical protein